MGGNDSNNGTKKLGEALQYDPDFTGPIKNRSCTDVLCLILFVIFFGCWIAVAVLAFKFGNPHKLISPTDSQGNTCGEGKFENKPVLFFFDLTKCARTRTIVRGCDTPQICVEKCPSQNFFPLFDHTFSKRRLREVDDRTNKLYCKYDVDEDQTVETLVNRGDCAQYVLHSDAVVGRCVPLLASLKEAKNYTEEMTALNVTQETLYEGTKYISKFLNLRDTGEKFLEDVKNSWKIILLGLVMAMFLCFVWIVIMRWLAWVMLWLSILLVITILGVGIWYCFHRYSVLLNRPKPDETERPSSKFTFFKPLGERKKTWLILGIVLCVVLVILLLIMIFLRSRIKLAIALVQESSKAVGNICSSLFFPVFPFILQFIFIVFGLTVAAYLSSASVPKNLALIPNECLDSCSGYKDYGECDDVEKFNKTCIANCPKAKCKFIKYESTNLITGAQIFNIFLLFWSVFLVVGFGQMVLAGAFSTWYWTLDKKNVPTFVITQSFGRTLRYHMGSIAFGSLLIAIVKTIRALLEYADRKLKQYSDNACAKCVMCCLRCCFWCLENFIKFINRNAYIMIAIYGKSFCTSAKDAFLLLMRNIARVIILDKVTDFLLFLGKLTIAGIMGLITYVFVSGKVKGSEYIVKDLNYVSFPIVVICIGSYIIASCFFSVYSIAVDTLFLCFLEDCEMNDGSEEKPYRMSKRLMKILGKKNLVDPEEKAD